MTGDLISRKVALEILMKYCPDDDGSCTKADVDPREMLDEIENLPAVDAAPVVHAKWMIERCAARCTHCGIGYRLSNGGPNAMRFKFCPNCGAKMDLEE